MHVRSSVVEASYANEAMPALGPEVWEETVLFTFHDFEHEAFLNLKLKERELANIGLAIVARLASRGRV